MKNFTFLSVTMITLLLAFAVGTTSVEAQSYCTITGSCDPYISMVTLEGGLSKTSTCGNYQNFTATDSATLTVNTPSQFTVSILPNYIDASLGIWIDWNHDGDFGEPDELIGSFANSAPFTGLITPPVSALLGKTRMRIKPYLPPLETLDPCASDGGEVEDYSIIVKGCSGSPNPADAITDNVTGTWKVKVPVNVAEQNNVSGTNFQIPVIFDSQSLIAAGKMKSNCSDLRFGNCDLSTRYNYWIESGINTATTKVWVMIPSLPALGTAAFFMHYDNDAGTVPSASSFDNTFPPNTRLILAPCSTSVVSGTNTYSWFEVPTGAIALISPSGAPFVVNARKIKITGTINGDGQGHAGGAAGQSGAGPGGGMPGSVVTPGSSAGGGGAYGGNGGIGGNALGTNGNGGIAYGSTTTITMGSGGGGPVGGAAGAVDGNGGGCVLLKAREVQITGTINLNGNAGSNISGAGFAGGGGAGGGLQLEAYSTSITGQIFAKGARGGSGPIGGGGGGGGRINLLSQNAFTPGTYNVANGLKGVKTNASNPNATDGTPGVVYTGSYAANEPTVSIIPEVAVTTSPASACQGVTTTLVATTGYSNYQFYVGATSVQNGASNTFSTSTLNNGDVVKVVATYSTCVIESPTVSITVSPPPTANAGSDVSICLGSSAQLTAGGGTGYSWSPVTGLSDPNISNPVASPAGMTHYTVTVTNAAGCTAMDEMIVNINAAPVGNAGTDVSICSGGSTQLNASGGTAYAWTSSVGLSDPNIANPLASPASSMTYTVTVTDANNCSASDEVTVTVNPLPTASAGSDVTVCTGDAATLNASGGTSYTWSPSTGLSCSNCQSPVANPSGNITYSVTVTDANGCSAKDAVSIAVTSAILADAGADVMICKGFTTQLNASGGATYSWLPTTGLSNASIANPVADPTVTITYTVTAGSSTCYDTDEVTVTVDPCTGISNIQTATEVTVNPNPSSGDLFVSGNDILSIEIFNLFGEIVHAVSIPAVNGVKVDVSGLTGGIYFLQVKSRQGTNTHKIIKN